MKVISLFLRTCLKDDSGRFFVIVIITITKIIIIYFYNYYYCYYNYRMFRAQGGTPDFK